MPNRIPKPSIETGARFSFLDQPVEEVARSVVDVLGAAEAEACAAVMVEHLGHDGDEDRRRLWMALLLEVGRIAATAEFAARSFN